MGLENLAPRVPSFYFGSFAAARPQLYIRGIGTRSFDPGSESSVGVLVDDVYAGRSSGRFGSLRDFERLDAIGRASCSESTCQAVYVSVCAVAIEETAQRTIV